MSSPVTKIEKRDFINGTVMFRVICRRHNFSSQFRLRANAEAMARCHDIIDHGKQRHVSEWAKRVELTEQDWSSRLRRSERAS